MFGLSIFSPDPEAGQWQGLNKHPSSSGSGWLEAFPPAPLDSHLSWASWDWQSFAKSLSIGTVSPPVNYATESCRQPL